MYQRNRNLFSFLAVLVTAGLITGVVGIFLALADQLGGGSQLVSSGIDSELSPAAAEPAFETLGSHSATVLSVSAAEDAPLIASGSYDNVAQLWDRNSKQTIPLPHDGRVNALTFSEENDLLVTGASSGELAVWFTPSGQLSDTVQTAAGQITSVAVAPRGKTVAVGSDQGSLTLWTITAGSNLQRLATLLPAGVPISAVAFHPIDDNLVLSGGQDGLVRVWDIDENAIAFTLDDGTQGNGAQGDLTPDSRAQANGPSKIVSIAMSNNGQYVASGSDDNIIRVWELESGKLIQTLNGHDSLVSDIDFSPDGTLLVSSSYDESLKVWEWARGLSLCTLEGHAGFVYSVAFTDSGNTLVSGGYDGTVRTWDLTATENQDCLPL